MPHLTQPLSAGSPLIDVWISVSTARAAALKQAGQRVPNPVRARTLIDTGASGTALDPRVLQSLSLTPTGTAHIRTPSTGGAVHSCNVFDISLTILHPTSHLLVGILPAIEADFSSQGIDGLLGRDVLASTLLIYDGAGGSFTLCF